MIDVKKLLKEIKTELEAENIDKMAYDAAFDLIGWIMGTLQQALTENNEEVK